MRTTVIGIDMVTAGFQTRTLRWLIGSLLAIGFSGNSGISPPVAAQEGSTRVKVELLAGGAREIEQLSIDDQGNATLDGETMVWTDLRSLAFPNSAIDQAQAPFEVLLVGGTRLVAERVVLIDEAIQIEYQSQRLQVPIEWFVGVRHLPLAPQTPLQAASLDEDRLVVQLEEGAQEVDGLLEAMTVDGVEFSFESNVREIPWSRIISLALATAGAEKTTEGMRVSLVDGMIWFGPPKSLDDQTLILEVGGVEVALRREQLLRIEVVSDRVAQLADLEPLEQEITGLLLPAREIAKNQSVLGTPLSVYLRPEGGRPGYQIMERGLGVPSGAKTSFDVNGYDRFVSLIGLDETSDGRADCVVVIQLDGREVFRQRLQGRDVAQEVELALDGAQKMTIVVEFGEGLDLGDHVDFCEARLIKN